MVVLQRESKERRGQERKVGRKPEALKPVWLTPVIPTQEDQEFKATLHIMKSESV